MYSLRIGCVSAAYRLRIGCVSTVYRAVSTASDGNTRIDDVLCMYRTYCACIGYVSAQLT